jgi:hypothetical protein
LLYHSIFLNDSGWLYSQLAPRCITYNFVIDQRGL